MKKPRKLRSRKAGLPPGSLVHIGDVKTSDPRLSIFDFGPDGLDERSVVDAGDLQSYARRHANLWVNFYGVHQPEMVAAIGKTFGLHPLVQEDILNTDQRQKIDDYADYLYVVLHRYELGPTLRTLNQDQISLIIGRDFLLTFQEQRSNTFEPVRQRLRADRGNLRRGGIDTLAYSLLDSVVDSYFHIIEELNDRAETLESEILGHPSPASLEAIHQLKRCVAHLRRNLHPLREVLGNLHRDAADFFRTEVQLYLRDVYDHTVHILESLDDLRDLTTGLLDVYLSTISHKVNLEVRTLTVFATIFMPATLIAGIFGMNFRQMPWLDLSSGFYDALGLMGVIAAVMLLMFWRRRYV